MDTGFPPSAIVKSSFKDSFPTGFRALETEEGFASMCAFAEAMVDYQISVYDQLGETYQLVSSSEFFGVPEYLKSEFSEISDRAYAISSEFRGMRPYVKGMFIDSSVVSISGDDLEAYGIVKDRMPDQLSDAEILRLGELGFDVELIEIYNENIQVPEYDDSGNQTFVRMGELQWINLLADCPPSAAMVQI